jgi:hypothetical protein
MMHTTQNPAEEHGSGGAGTSRNDQSDRTGLSPALPDNRADLVLFLGIFSLFLCGPLGAAAWLIGTHDLRRIRAGGMSSRKLGALKVGTALGMVGTILFVVSLTLVVMLLHRGIPGGVTLWQTKPLTSEQWVFAGEWYGKKGTLIRINQDGTADYQSDRASVTGGRVVIGDDSISIGFLGVSRKWHIDRRPERENGNWVMELDGEEFVRTGDELLV